MNSIWYYEWTNPNDVYDSGIVFPFKTEAEAITHCDKHHSNDECDIQEVLFSEVYDVYTGE